MQIFGLKACDTCRKARKALPDSEFHDVREGAIPDEILQRALDEFGDALVNTRSTTWRGMSDAERAMPPKEQLRAYPALMKRPLIVTEARMHLGWTAESRASLGAE